MNNIKLTIFTGVQDTDIIDLGYYNPSIEGIVRLALIQSGHGDQNAQMSDFVGMTGNNGSVVITAMLDDINLTNPETYKVFQTVDLLAAQAYLNKLKVACDTYPACTVKIETL